MPGFLVSTSLGLPPEETPNTIGAFIATSPPPALPANTAPSSAAKSPYRPISPGTNAKTGAERPPSRNHSKSPSSGRTGTPRRVNYRSSSKSSQQRSTSKQDKDGKYPRHQSKSPNNKDRNNSRGRHPTPSTKSESRPSSFQSYVSELDTLAFYTIHSKSPNFKRKQSLPTIFRRPMTPKTYQHLKNNYFFKTSGGSRFSDVFKAGRCLRCYASGHRASACPVYTKPCGTPCRFCHFLFHESDNCKFYDRNGSTRPTTPTK